MAKRYYWLRLHKDFFKQHEIKVIESMPNGKDYILFYLKLLVESISHEGKLRFSDTIPYNEEMLSAITETNIDVVRSAMKIFTELKMIEVLDDFTIYMTEVDEMIGFENDEHTREMNRIRQQRHRDKLKTEQNNFDLLNISDEKALCHDLSRVTRHAEIRDKSIENNNIIIPNTYNNSSSTAIRNADAVVESDEKISKSEMINNFVSRWNNELVPLGLKKISAVAPSQKRYKQFFARVEEYGIESFDIVIESIKHSDFLQGKNDRSWKPDFEWVTCPNNFPKIIEGKYNNADYNPNEEHKELSDASKRIYEQMLNQIKSKEEE